MPDKTPQKKLKTSETPELIVEPESLELATASQTLPLGTIISEKYRVVECISSGDERVVYKVEHLFVNKTLALKMLTGEINSARRERFLAEAKMASLVDSPNIARASDTGIFGEQPFYVMDFAEGESLADYLKRCGRLTYDDIFSVFIPLATVLQELHDAGVVHCGVMPSNIMLVGKQGNWQSRLIGFGVAKKLENSQASPTNLKRYTGSFHYLSPEQCSGRRVDARTDVYSLGCSLFEAITARPPFCGESNEAIRKKHLSDEPPTLKEASLGRDFPMELEQTVRGMLVKDPQLRTESARQVAETLMRCKLSGQLRIRSKPTEKAKAAAFEKKLLILGLVSALALGVLFFLWIKVNEPRPILTKTEADYLSHPGSLRADPDSIMSSVEVRSIERGTRGRSATRLRNQRAYEYEAFKPDTTTASFLQKVEDQDGKQLRTYKFPDEGIGHIQDISATIMTARGELKWIWRGPLTFTPIHDALLRYPNLFRRFKTDEIGSILFRGCSGLTDETFAQLANYKNLEHLSFEQVELGNAALVRLEKLPKLNSLDLLSTSVSAGGLEQFSILPQLKRLALGEMMDVDHILKALHRSKNLEYLELRNCKNLTQKDIEVIAAFPNLKKFVMRTFWPVDASLLNGLAASKSLRELDISKTSFGEAGLKGLGTFKNLKILEVSKDDVDVELRKKFEKAMPNTYIRYNN
ncbi:MAG: hypothetical protein C0507_05625 [Cyanobacteria bacterium PR.3.49]|nr:hypothetical protein [Cyanobacteria bacterium PR.3.49]